MLEYADDRPWPGSTAWSDAVSRSALHTIAAAVEHLAGYEIACINVVHDDTLRVVAVHGTDAQRDVLMDSQMPVGAMEAELASGDVLGRFVLVPAGRYDGNREYGLVPEGIETAPGDDAYDVEDLLAAPICDGEGRMIATLAVDVPLSRRRPDPAAVERLDRYAELAETAVRMAVERNDHLERVRLSRVAREVVGSATRHLSMAKVFAETATVLTEGFRARGVWVQVVDEAPIAAGRDVEQHPLPPFTSVDSARGFAVAQRAWARGTVGLLSLGDTTYGDDDPVFGPYLDISRGVLEQQGVESAMFIPIGVGEKCLGWMAFSREAGRPAWTPTEQETARDIGRDLGRAVLNARAFEREQAAVAELRALDLYKSQLVATLSHELKTPLSSVLGNLELLEGDDLDSDDGRRSISAISRGAHRLVRVVDDLMLLAKAGDPGHELVSRPIDLLVLVDDVVEMTAATARQGRLSVSVTGDDEPALARGDADELDWVISNLLSNALKYTPPGGRIGLDVRREGDEVVLTCTDDGIGISPEDRSRLFREFFRSADPDTRSQPGSGIGLAIADRIVRRHGGRIEVTSELGEGSTFVVRLPAWAGGDQPAEDRSGARSTA